MLHPARRRARQQDPAEASPTWHTLTRLLAAAGFDLDTQLTVRPIARSHMLDDVARILRLTPEERLREVANAARKSTRRACRKGCRSTAAQ